MRTFLGYIVVIAFLLTSCKKETKIEASDVETTIQQPHSANPSMGKFTSKVVLSSRGHLLFDSEVEFFNFLKEISDKTKGQVFSEYSTLGFTSIANGLYSSTSTDSISAGMQQFQFLVPSDSIVEIASTLYKPYSSMGKLLSIDSTNLNATTQGYLNADIYNSASMNKFILNSDVTDSLLLFDFVQGTRHGYSGTVMADGKTRPMFGSHTDYPTAVEDTYDVYGNCVHLVHHYAQVTTFFFWIANHHAAVYTGTTSSPGTNC